jgi:hypothetical protein
MTEARAKEYQDACTEARVLYIQAGGGSYAKLKEIIDNMNTGTLNKAKIYRLLTLDGRTVNALCQKDELVRAWSQS